MTSVAILEDEAITSQALSESLEQLGYEVLGCASTAKDMLTLLKTNAADVVILDIIIKGPKDGISVAAALRQSYNPAIVFLTSLSDSVTLKRASAVKPNGYLVKPFRLEDIRSAVKIAIANHDDRDKEIDGHQLSIESGPILGGLSPYNLNKVEAFVKENLSESLLLSDLADCCRLSEKHFATQFKKSTQLTPHDYIVRERISKAKSLLLETKASVAEIARLVGYVNASHFSTSFRKITGVSPSRFRLI